ncbi:MAG TPA: hypothetical protein VGP97_23165 [Burkholderiales bacterium]|jgi:hypothetical protein|nr:hypothetical protein [Burkholderiales bacterium]
MAVMAAERAELAVLFEHPEWQKPLFQALERRGVRYAAVDLKKAAFSDADAALAPLYFNQASAGWSTTWRARSGALQGPSRAPRRSDQVPRPHRPQ